ncbi:uncharacterized protein LOC141526654 [Cotesia typhae]|uniref:uncharacterized protein LOC141526654 n=1 Tax=Cotesia typhae TaxID=2053667 RepID=UPI003D695FD0
MSYHIRHNNYLFIRDVRNQSESGQRYLCAYNFNNQPCNVKLWCLATGERVTMGTHHHHLNAGVNIPPSEEAASFRDNHAPRGINNSSRTQRLRFNRALALQAASSFRATQSTRNTRINPVWPDRAIFLPPLWRRARLGTSKRCVSVSRKTERSRRNPRKSNESRGINLLPRETEE